MSVQLILESIKKDKRALLDELEMIRNTRQLLLKSSENGDATEFCLQEFDLMDQMITKQLDELDKRLKNNKHPLVPGKKKLILNQAPHYV